jgi:hypothetical protein
LGGKAEKTIGRPLLLTIAFALAIGMLATGAALAAAGGAHNTPGPAANALFLSNQSQANSRPAQAGQ